MRILDIALKDLRQITRDRKTFIFLLIMPVAFTLLFGYAFGGNRTADPRLPVGLADEDNSPLSQQLVVMLENSEVVRLDVTDSTAAELTEQVNDEALAAAIIIPAGFATQMQTEIPLPVQVIAAGQSGFTVQSDLQTAVSRLNSAVQTARISTDTATEQGLLTDENARQAHFAEAQKRALTAWETPPVTIAVQSSSALTAEAAEENSNYSVFAHSSPGMMAQFAIAALIGAAGILVVEKKSGSLRRLLTTNLRVGEIMLGHYLAMFMMIFMQLATLIIFGQLALGLPYFSQPLATGLITIVTALFCASLGLLIGTLAKTEEQAIFFSLIPMFVLSALGGAWVPLEFTPESFQRIAYLTPVAWVMDGYTDILVRGLGITALGTAVAVLLAYTLGMWGIAAWRFRAE